LEFEFELNTLEEMEKEIKEEAKSINEVDYLNEL